tara:strand:+ start:5689 stop:6141 length:453 start_codon:yes stop_codon:yes gene_type:complete
MKNLKLISSVFVFGGFLLLASCSNNENVDKLLQNETNRKEIYAKIASNQEMMNELMDVMMSNESSNKMMMNHKGMMGSRNMIKNPEMMKNMMGNMMKDGKMMNQMMQMMHDKGIMSDECMQSCMNKMKDMKMSNKSDETKMTDAEHKSHH